MSSETSRRIAPTGRQWTPWPMTPAREQRLIQAAKSDHPALAPLAAMKLRQTAYLEAVEGMAAGGPSRMIYQAANQAEARDRIIEAAGVLGPDYKVGANVQPDGSYLIWAQRFKIGTNETGRPYHERDNHWDYFS